MEQHCETTKTPRERTHNPEVAGSNPALATAIAGQACLDSDGGRHWADRTDADAMAQLLADDCCGRPTDEFKIDISPA